MTQQPPESIRILLVDDHVLFREGLARLLESEPGLSVIAQCGTVAEAIGILKSLTVDVILLDLDLGSERGSDLLDKLVDIQFSGKVLLVTASIEDREIPILIRKGIAGILRKHQSPALLVQGIRDAMTGKVSLPQDVIQKAFEDTGRDRKETTELTKREKEILSFIFEGFSNKEIANRLNVSEGAVKASLQNLFGKTGVRTRSQLVRVALERFKGQF